MSHEAQNEHDPAQFVLAKEWLEEEHWHRWILVDSLEDLEEDRRA